MDYPKALTAAAWLLTLASASLAGVLRVPADYPTVLAGVDAAASGDTVLVAPGVWTDTDTRIIGWPQEACAFPSGGVSIVSEGGPAVTTIDLLGTGSIKSGVLLIGASEPVLVEGFTFTGNTAAVSNGVCVLGSGSAGLTLRDCVFVDNESTDDLAPAVLVNGCHLTIERCEFVRNNAFSDVITVIRSDIVFRESSYRENHGLIYVDLIDYPFSLTHVFEDSEFLDNQSRVLLLAGRLFEVRRCLFARNNGGAIRVSGDDAVIEFNTFAFDSASNGAAVHASVGGPIRIRFNTFFGCDSDFSGGAVTGSGADLRFRRNVVSNSTGGEAIALPNGASLQSSCNDLWSNEGGDIVGGTLDPSDFTADPQFCNLSQLDFTLHSTSPCAEENAGTCGQIGAWGVGCGPTSVGPASWAHVKSLYR